MSVLESQRYALEGAEILCFACAWNDFADKILFLDLERLEQAIADRLLNTPKSVSQSFILAGLFDFTIMNNNTNLVVASKSGHSTARNRKVSRPHSAAGQLFTF